MKNIKTPKELGYEIVYTITEGKKLPKLLLRAIAFDSALAVMKLMHLTMDDCLAIEEYIIKTYTEEVGTPKYRIIGGSAEVCEELDAMQDDNTVFETMEEAREQVAWFRKVDIAETGKACTYYIVEE